MQMTTDARRWLDETVARALARHTLREPERSGVHYELMSHLHAAAERKAQEQGAAEVTTLHLQEALREMGGEGALEAAFVAPHARSLPRAGFWKRAFAYLIDLVVVTVATEVLFGLLFLLLWPLLAPLGVDAGPQMWDLDPTDPLGAFDFDSRHPLLGFLSLAAFLAWLALALGYYAYMESTRQQTLGKMALRLRVARAAGGAVDPRAALVRNLVKVHPGLVALDALVMLLFLRDERQRLSDRVAETVVVEEG